MNQEQYLMFRMMLLDLRAEMSDRLDSLTRGGLSRSAQDSIKELSMYDNHPADVASETYERGKDVGMRVNTEFMIDQIDLALKRMAEGTYGVCQACGHEIQTERLRAVPWTVYCQECKQLLDERQHKARPVEEQVIKMPFGKYDQVRDLVAYDGQDTWEDVSLGGTANSPQDQPGAVSFGDMREIDEPGISQSGRPR